MYQNCLPVATSSDYVARWYFKEGINYKLMHREYEDYTLSYNTPKLEYLDSISDMPIHGLESRRSMSCDVISPSIADLADKKYNGGDDCGYSICLKVENKSFVDGYVNGLPLYNDHLNSIYTVITAMSLYSSNCNTSRPNDNDIRGTRRRRYHDQLYIDYEGIRTNVAGLIHSELLSSHICAFMFKGNPIDFESGAPLSSISYANTTDYHNGAIIQSCLHSTEHCLTYYSTVIKNRHNLSSSKNHNSALSIWIGPWHYKGSLGGEHGHLYKMRLVDLKLALTKPIARMFMKAYPPSTKLYSSVRLINGTYYGVRLINGTYYGQELFLFNMTDNSNYAVYFHEHVKSYLYLGYASQYAVSVQSRYGEPVIPYIPSIVYNPHSKSAKYVGHYGKTISSMITFIADNPHTTDLAKCLYIASAMQDIRNINTFRQIRDLVRVDDASRERFFVNNSLLAKGLHILYDSNEYSKLIRHVIHNLTGNHAPDHGITKCIGLLYDRMSSIDPNIHIHNDHEDIDAFVVRAETLNAAETIFTIESILLSIAWVIAINNYKYIASREGKNMFQVLRSMLDSSPIYNQLPDVNQQDESTIHTIFSAEDTIFSAEDERSLNHQHDVDEDDSFV